MATIERNGEQPEGWKIEITLSPSDLEQITTQGRAEFIEGDGLSQTRGRPVVELIVNLGTDKA